MLASISSGEARRRIVDGVAARPADDRRRPAVGLFMPDRLALVKGPPSPRRAHLDRLSAALRPARAETRRDTAGRWRSATTCWRGSARGGDPSSLAAWDRELADRALPLVEARAGGGRRAGGRRSRRRPRSWGWPVEPTIATGRAPASTTPTARGRARERRDGDLARGFTGYGPHRDEVELSFGGRSLRRYGSQGQQRLGLLALLFAEREALRAARRQLPLLLLDDVMSELDPERRGRLVAMLSEEGRR